MSQAPTRKELNNNMMKNWITLLSLLLICHSAYSAKNSKYNIILVYADDISARELPAYNSTVWSLPYSLGITGKDPNYRAQTPVLDRFAEEAAFVRTAWANSICSPARATIMTGRYAP
jgi:arylsulfatase A-like enzyme